MKNEKHEELHSVYANTKVRMQASSGEHYSIYHTYKRRMLVPGDWQEEGNERGGGGFIGL